MYVGRRLSTKGNQNEIASTIFYLVNVYSLGKKIASFRLRRATTKISYMNCSQWGLSELKEAITLTIKRFPTR